MIRKEDGTTSEIMERMFAEQMYEMEPLGSTLHIGSEEQLEQLKEELNND